ncbi:MAG: aminoacyl-tRNA hydrolase [Armatimonadota bacterium]
MFRKKPQQPQFDIEWVIVGLGNPGPEYARTRHNVGFDAIEQFASKHNIKLDRGKHKARIGTGQVNGVGVALVKPMTYMNLSGQSIAPTLREFGVKPDRLIVIADELDFPVGKVRMKPKGGSAGHNGHKSIIQSLGTDEYARIRVGIHSEERGETIDFVLSKFHPDERVDIDRAIAKTIDGIEAALSGGIERALIAINE